MKFSNREEFELHVHKCFGVIFELLRKVDDVVSAKAEQEEAEGKEGEMTDLRDMVEDIMLHCHLAWQYHRLSKDPGRLNVWDNEDDSPDGEE